MQWSVQIKALNAVFVCKHGAPQRDRVRRRLRWRKCHDRQTRWTPVC
jgi:hypothetical protein